MLAAVVGSGLLGAVLVLLAAAYSRKPDTLVLTWTIIIAFAFNAISLFARWLVTKTLKRAILAGRVPLFIGLIKVAGFIAVCPLILAMVVGLIAGSPVRETTLTALVFGALAFAILVMLTDGVLNVIVISRHSRGALAAVGKDG